MDKNCSLEMCSEEPRIGDRMDWILSGLLDSFELLVKLNESFGMRINWHWPQEASATSTSPIDTSIQWKVDRLYEYQRGIAYQLEHYSRFLSRL